MIHTGCTVWFTGLPSSGKSTLARLLCEHLTDRGLPAAVLDGDELRQWLTKDLPFTKEGRDENIRRITCVAELLTRVGAFALVAAISPYAEARARARQKLRRFVEVHVDCPVAICCRRDPKGLYARARQGEIAHFTGISDPYEPPMNPEIRVRTDRLAPRQCLDLILDKLVELQYIPDDHAHCTPRTRIAALRHDEPV
ncbi:MAG: adenylyl-sulfate kinase [Nitrospirae bacterium]|nr:MAG: adenylyl-sulfate kinase [Nitrospirota bacterium]